MLRIVSDDKIPFLHGVLDRFAEVRYMPGSKIAREHLSDADALIIRTRTKCTPGLLEGTRVKFIGTATIGFDHIDTHYCESRNIKWVNAPGCNSWSVQQYVAAALLNISAEFRLGLKEKTIGIVGVGNVGSKVEKFAALLGMNVILNDPPRQRKEGGAGFSDLESLLRESDFITMHVPLNFVGEDKTFHMINDKTLKKVRKGTWFINSSRGEVAETGALISALKSGRLAGAVIDVWENEPDLDLSLMHKAFIATPHIAGYSTDGKANGTAVIVNRLAEFFGLPLSNWYPDALPEPEEPVITIDCRDKSGEQIVREAVKHTYDIMEDDMRLRFAPSDFEKLRGDYPVRREFGAFKVHLISPPGGMKDLLQSLGFGMQQ